MSKKLIALLGCSIEGNRIIHLILRAEGHLLVPTVDGGRRCINQVLDRMMPARFKQVVKTDDV